MKVKNCNGKVMLYIILAILILGIVVGSSLAIYYAIQEPIVQLNGDTNCKIEVGNNYLKESGAIALKNNKDISDDLEIKSDVDTNKVGNYKVHYLIKGKEYATRSVYVIDDVPPTITLKVIKLQIYQLIKNMKNLDMKQQIIMMEILLQMFKLQKRILQSINTN